MAENNLIHVKLEHDEALQSKRDILTSEADILKIVQNIRRYKLVRLNELKTKAKLHRKLKEVSTAIKKLEQVLPAIKIPKILQDEPLTSSEAPKKRTAKKTTKKHHAYDSDIESQLQDIQDRLKNLK